MKNSMDAITPTYLWRTGFTIAALLDMAFLKQIRGMSMQEAKMRAIGGLFLFISGYCTYGLKYTTASKNAFIFHDVVCGDAHLLR